MYALTGIALGDAFISTWAVKYRVDLLRPIQYIQTFIDPNWKPLLSTPAFPEYPSGHSVASGAASIVLQMLFGDVPMSDITHLDRQLIPRTFTTFAAMADEAAMSRMYGGIHYRVGIDNGLKQGRCIGQSVLERIHLHS